MNKTILRIILLLTLLLSSCERTTPGVSKETDHIETPSTTIEIKTEIAVPASNSFKGRQWTNVVADLEELGFQNVSTIAIDDIDSHSEIKDGTVESVAIDDNANYSEGDVFSYNSNVIVAYHNIPKLKMPFSSFSIDSMTLDEVIAELSDSGFTSITTKDPLFATPWTLDHQAPLSMRFSRQEYWNGLTFPSPGDLPNPGIKPGSPALQADSLPTELQGKPQLSLLSSM